MTSLQTTASYPVGPNTNDVIVTKVTTEEEKKQFILFQYEVYKNDPSWVPPLMMDREDFLNPKKNPFFTHSTVELFLARRGGKIVGRIAAIDNTRYNTFHETSIGWFGMYEAIDDAAVAKALLTTAADWSRAKGFKEFLGPANFSSNQEWGALIEGFDQPAVLMMTYNPRYYLTHFENFGLTKVKDLWAWKVDINKPLPEKVARIAEKVRGREDIKVRQANMKDWANEVVKIKEIYNAAWEKNWGFVPMTDAEFDHLAKDLKLLLKPELTLIAEVKGEAVAFCITLPDANIAFKQVTNGRLTTFGVPIGLVKLLLGLKKVRTGRLAIMGIKEGFRRRGLDSVLLKDTFEAGQKLGWTGGEISWTLEDNDMVNRPIQVFGGEKYKTYRVYGMPLSSAPAPLKH